MVNIGLLALSAVLLSFAFAPLGQFYLAWVALVPWLIVVASARTTFRALGWGWLGGALFFLISLSYVFPITIAGAIALTAYMALHWGVAALAIRGLGFVPRFSARPARMLLAAGGIAIVWTSLEWVRGNAGFALPLLYLGHTQTPVLAVCQIADLAGAYGVSFVVAMVNALGAITLLAPAPRRRAWPAWAGAAVMVFLVAGYGAMRMSQETRSPGPTVLVIQPNDRNFADKTTLDKQREYVAYHLASTREALRSRQVDLIVWSETTMPALNPEPRGVMRATALGGFLEQVHSAIRSVATGNDSGVVAGGYYVGYESVNGKEVPSDYRNSAYFYDRSGVQAGRYDKIHLMAFGEYIPFRGSWPPLHRLLSWLGPNREEYVLTAGAGDATTVFPLATRSGISSRFVTPICFDDLDARLVARMFRGLEPGDGAKRADLLVNLTNDGWFHWWGPQQHLQAAVFRSIENRVPTARAVNTGVSGFIDSCGRTDGIVAFETEGTSVRQVMIDRRVTFYTRFGDVFAVALLLAFAAMIVAALIRRTTCRPAA